jgi:hypothetical protein
MFSMPPDGPVSGRSLESNLHREAPDRVSGLAPEFVSLAESRTKALNAAYSEAMRACHGGALMPTGCNQQ